MTKRHLKVLPDVDDSFLDDLRIATPCSADWEQMQGDDRVRHCGDCRLNVYNVAEMTRAEAATLITMSEGKRVCMRLYRRPDGTLITQDCWERLRAARRRGWVAFAAALVIVGLTQLGLRFAALGWLLQWASRKPPIVTMGTIAEPIRQAPAPAPAPAPEPRPLMGEIEPQPALMGAVAVRRPEPPAKKAPPKTIRK